MKKLSALLFLLLPLINIGFCQELFGPIETWGGSFTGYYGNFMADVNGDGKNDIIKVNNDKIYVKISNGNSFLSEQAWTNEVFVGTTGSFSSKNRTYFVDVTGDGKADAVAVKNDKIYIRRSNGSTFLTPEAWTSGAFSPESPPGVNPTWYYDIIGNFFADVTGEGRSDAIVTHWNSVVVRQSTGSSFFTEQIWSDVYLAYDFADMNGDYYADGYQSTDGTTPSTSVMLSNGTFFEEASQWHNGYLGTTALKDVTGDGKADVIISHWSAGIIVKVSTGSGFLASVYGTQTPFRNNEYNTNGCFFSDVTGDGKADAILVQPDQILVRRSNFQFSDCSTDLVINNSSYLKSNAIARTIVTEGILSIQSYQSNSMRAVEQISLKPGFSIMNGAGFIGKVQSCASAMAGGRSRSNDTEGFTYEDLIKSGEINSPLNNIFNGAISEPRLASYPNPASTSTVITLQYLVEDSGLVELTLYDMFGQLIDTLLDEYREAGIYQYMYDPSHLSSGFYYYSLKSNNSEITNRFIIVK